VEEVRLDWVQAAAPSVGFAATFPRKREKAPTRWHRAKCDTPPRQLLNPTSRFHEI